MTPGGRLLVMVARGQLDWLAALAVAAVAGSVVALLLPNAMAAAVDAALAGLPAWPAIRMFLLLAVAEVIVDVADVFATARFTTAATTDLRGEAVHHLAWSGDTVDRLTADCDAAGSLSVVVVRLGVAVFTSAGALLALVLLDWRLAVVFVTCTSLAVLLARKHLWMARPLPRLHSAGVCLWCGPPRLMSPAVLLLPTVELAVLVAAGFGVVDGRLTAGQVLAALVYVVLALSFVRNIPLLPMLATTHASADRLAEVMARPSAEK